ncbi:MAG TPA: prolyl oligopeptidase family serine peptidase [Candidatus Dormibacteraeota bacterium]|nr:prolyl oligopeptidase family serine peptidase [Candidatus Dormibacteraeota bacterium]
MKRSLVLALVLVLCACSGGTSSSAAHVSPSPASTTKTYSGSIGGAAYSVEVPAGWNGTLFLYSHGYTAPGRPNPAAAAPDSGIGDWLLANGNALAASSYRSTGWAIEDALHDQMALVDWFDANVGQPKRVIAWGGSLGGIISAGLVQEHPDRFAGALPLCGVLAGGAGTWNTALDAAYAFKTLLAPQSALQLVHITSPDTNLQAAKKVIDALPKTPQTNARMALVAALTDLPGWFLPTDPEPALTDYAAQVVAQTQWESRVDFAFAFSYRAELEKRAGGNPSWNAGVDYRKQLDLSIDRSEVLALYAAAGLDLQADLAALNAGATIRPDAAAVDYLQRSIAFDGRLGVPVLTMHTTGDGLVAPQEETAYADAVARAGKQDLLRQVFVHRAGHCAFTNAEVVVLIKALLRRLDTGSWDDSALAPAAMNAAATDLGAAANSLGGLIAMAPAFAAFAPGPYLRPFAKGAKAP